MSQMGLNGSMRNTPFATFSRRTWAGCYEFCWSGGLGRLPTLSDLILKLGYTLKKWTIGASAEEVGRFNTRLSGRASWKSGDKPMT